MEKSGSNTKRRSSKESGEQTDRLRALERALELERAKNRDLAERASRHDRLIELLPDAIFVHRGGVIVFANPAAVSLHHAETADQLVGRKLIELIHPDNRGSIIKEREALADGREPSTLVQRRLRLDGSEFIAESRGTAITWEGDPATLVVVRDVTEREKAKQALDESERRYRNMIEGSTFGIQISRLNGKRLFVNRKFVEMFGYDSAEEMLAITEPGALVAPHDREWVVGNRHARERNEPAPEIYEYDALRKDRSFMPVQVFFRRLYWEGEAAVQRTFIDITERRRAEEGLRQSEERYRSLVQMLPQPVLVTDHGRILYCNQAAVRLFGAANPDQLIGTNQHDLTHPEDRSKVQPRTEGDMAKRPVSSMLELRRRRLDGTEFISESCSAPFVWQGKTVRLVMINDITERRMAETALTESEERYRTLAELSPVGMIVHTNGVIVFANPAMARIVGAGSPDDLIGLDSIELVVPEQRDEVMARRQMVNAGIETGIAEARFNRFDGSETHVDRVLSPVTWQGKPSFLVLVRDIGERVRAEEALRDSEERYRSLVELMPEPVLVTEGGIVLFCNPAAVNIFGAENADRLIGINHLTLIHPEDRHFIEPRVTPDAAQKPVTDLVELRRFRLDGAEFTSESCSAPFAWDGKGARLVIIHDITERKRIERERERMVGNLLAARRRIEEQAEELRRMAEKSDRARREAQAASQAKSEFLALMSHELRTPLNAVLGFSEIISTEAFGPLGSNKYREYATDIFESGQHLLELINDILDLSKVESGKEEIHDEDIDLDEFLPRLMKLVSGRAERGAITLSLDCPRDLPRLRADPRKVKQVLVNLLSNGAKFTPEGGHVTLKVWCRPESGHVFQVQDTGIGIALEDIPKALSPFSQIESELNRKVEGTGLGLPLSKVLVELHSGSFDLQSELGAGTTVTVRFPAERVVGRRTAGAWQNRQSA